jgi:hypothetical protein
MRAVFSAGRALREAIDTTEIAWNTVGVRTRPCAGARL